MREPSRAKTIGAIVALVAWLLVMLAGTAVTLVAHMTPADWAGWVWTRIGIQVGGGLVLGVVGWRLLQAPAWLTIAPGLLFGLLLAWSATPDLIEGPVSMNARVVGEDISNWGTGNEQIGGEVCLEGDDATFVCVHPEGMKASRWQAELPSCKSGVVSVTLLRHLDVLLDATCAPSLSTDEAERDRWSARRRKRMGEVAALAVRSLPESERERAAASLGTAEADVFVGLVYAATADDAWLETSLEEAIVLRDDYAGLIATDRALDLFPDQAPALLTRAERRNGRNAADLKRKLGKP